MSESELEQFRQHQDEAQRGSELKPIDDSGQNDVDLDKLNQFITIINRQVHHENVKSSIEDAISFLRRKSFLLESGNLSTLGYLVCGLHPADKLGAVAQVHAFLQIAPNPLGSAKLADDKKIIIGSVIDLMQESINFILQKLQIAINTSGAGKADPELPETLLRETVNNALAHRDYTIDRPVSIWVRPGREVEIRNPGCFRKNQLMESLSAVDPLRRVVPDPLPRNPKLAQTLGLFNKWEGQGIGMATLVNLCLANRIDLPTYRIHSHSEVTLVLRSGALLDDEMNDIFKLYDRFISKRLRGGELRKEEKIVLSYIIKARRADEKGEYSIILTRDNDHFQALNELEKASLIRRHAKSDSVYVIYEPDPAFLRENFDEELIALFGPDFKNKTEDERQILTEIYRHATYSTNEQPSARALAFISFHRQGRDALSKSFEDVYRVSKRLIERLKAEKFLKPKFEKTKAGRDKLVGYMLNAEFLNLSVASPSKSARTVGTLRNQGAPGEEPMQLDLFENF